MDITKYVRKITREVIIEFGSVDETVSVALVGSSSSEKYETESINDVDLILIFTKITPPILSKIRKLGSRLCSDLSSNDIDFEFSMECGPAKHWSKTRRIILIHLIPLDLPTYKDPRASILAYSWQNFSKLLLGISLKEIRNVERVTSSQVVNDEFGLDDCIRMIENDAVYYHDWVVSNEECKRVSGFRKVSGYRLLELLCYCVLRSASNSVRAKGKLVDLSDGMLEEFERIFGHLKKCDSPRRFAKYKRHLRARTIKLNEVSLLDYKKNALEFLCELKSSLTAHTLTLT